ncbi:MAG: GNAT family N-acetyltransferase [Leptolyngbyaceae bacterium]|nr:GNAT family N-acetyltransferase [Leptolyngbyaceae bacterium]
MGVELIPGYVVEPGTRLDRALLLKFMQRTYHELYPEKKLDHLAKTVDQYLAGETQLWWVIPELFFETQDDERTLPMVRRSITPNAPVGCLWLGNAVDQICGDRHTYVFLLYVTPHERHQGIGTALMRRAENWAAARGDRQIALQVFHDNEPAWALYHKLGYVPRSIWMAKPLRQV